MNEPEKYSFLGRTFDSKFEYLLFTFTENPITPWRNKPFINSYGDMEYRSNDDHDAE